MSRWSNRTRYNSQLPLHPLMREFVTYINQDQRTLSQIAKKAGYSANAIYRWTHGEQPRITTFVDVLNTLGYTVKIVKLNEPGAGRLPPGTTDQ